MFQDFSKIAICRKDSKAWLEKLILGNNDVNFDNICQNINMRLITLLLFSIKSKSSYHFNVLTMLQSGTMDGILPDNIVIDVRMVIVSILLVLSEREAAIKSDKVC